MQTHVVARSKVILHSLYYIRVMINKRRLTAAMVSLFVYTLPASVRAQETAQVRVEVTSCTTREGAITSAFLPRDHWSREAARRLHAAGAAPAGFDPAALSITAATMRSVLAHAADRSEAFPTAPVYQKRFEEEFGVHGPCAPAARVSAGAFGDRETGRILLNEQNYTSGTTAAEPALSELGGEVRAEAWLPHLALSAVGRAGDDARIEQASVQLEYRVIGLFAGRVAPGHRTTESGAVVLRDDVTFDGAGLYLTHPVYAPGFLRKIGPIGFESMLAPADDQVDNYGTWFWSARGSLQPLSFIGFNITRAAYISSLSPQSRPSLSDITNMVIGQNHRSGDVDYADNQVVAVDGWIRSPTRSVPLTFYWDWGADDSYGGWWHRAARVFGLRSDALPGLSHVSAGIERTAIDGGTSWYKHGQMTAGWSEKGVLLGHPLGGQGRQTLVFVSGDLFDARLFVRAAAYRGVRGDNNVFAPLYAGHMDGAQVNATLRLKRHIDVRMQASTEQGDDWSHKLLHLTAAYTFF